MLSRTIEDALTIRAVEYKLLDLFELGEISGTIHTCLGQETCATALAVHLEPGKDAFFGSHRCHGHYLAQGGQVDALLAEVMGRQGAACLGRGGSQHLHHKNFFSSGIQGATAPLAAGYAWALKTRGVGGMAVAQLGDGTLGQGVVYETLTFAALLQLPVLFYWNTTGSPCPPMWP